jgi:hypothetical protein
MESNGSTTPASGTSSAAVPGPTTGVDASAFLNIGRSTLAGSKQGLANAYACSLQALYDIVLDELSVISEKTGFLMAKVEGDLFALHSSKRFRSTSAYNMFCKENWEAESQSEPFRVLFCLCAHYQQKQRTSGQSSPSSISKRNKHSRMPGPLSPRRSLRDCYLLPRNLTRRRVTLLSSLVFMIAI